MKTFRLKPPLPVKAVKVYFDQALPEGVVSAVASDGVRFYWWGGFCLKTSQEGWWLIESSGGHRFAMSDSDFRAEYEEVAETQCPANGEAI